jgi:hypothetical protein
MEEIYGSEKKKEILEQKLKEKMPIIDLKTK